MAPRSRGMNADESITLLRFLEEHTDRTNNLTSIGNRCRALASKVAQLDSLRSSYEFLDAAARESNGDSTNLSPSAVVVENLKGPFDRIIALSEKETQLKRRTGLLRDRIIQRFVSLASSRDEHDQKPRSVRSSAQLIEQQDIPAAADLATLNDKIDMLADLIENHVPVSDQLWSYGQVAAKCEVTDATVRSWVSYGQVNTVLGSDGKRRIPDSELRVLLKNAKRPVRRRQKRSINIPAMQ